MELAFEHLRINLVFYAATHATFLVCTLTLPSPLKPEASARQRGNLVGPEL
jgi:hypothetical protein